MYTNSCALIIINTSTEYFWKVYSRMRDQDDQRRINHALAHMGVRWKKRNSLVFDTNGKGIGGFRVSALSQRSICRMKRCYTRLASRYFVWHKGGGKMNIGKKKAGALSFWYLRGDWKNITNSSSAKGVAWLREVMTQ